MSKLPKVLRRGARLGPYTISFSPAIDHIRALTQEPSTIGHFDPIAMCITVDPGLRRDVMRVVVWHEVKHVCDYLGGMGYSGEYKEEEYVTASAPHEVEFMGENRALVKWLSIK